MPKAPDHCTASSTEKNQSSSLMWQVGAMILAFVLAIIVWWLALAQGTLITGALALPIEKFAETTSLIVLMVFMSVNLALIRIKLAGKTSQRDIFLVPLWVPVFGFITSMLLLVSGLI